MRHYKKYFIQALRNNYPLNYAGIISTSDNHYSDISKDTRFALHSKNPIDKRLDFCAYFLALIKTLHQQGETFENTRKICLEIVTAWVQPKNKLQAIIKKSIPIMIRTLPGRLLIHSLKKKVRTNKNTGGFIANIITDKKETYGLGYGIDILECGICKLFKKHHYEKYASILCEVDEITSAMAGLKLIRSGTLANGASKCDFRFKRENKNHG